MPKIKNRDVQQILATVSVIGQRDDIPMQAGLCLEDIYREQSERHKFLEETRVKGCEKYADKKIETDADGNEVEKPIKTKVKDPETGNEIEKFVFSDENKKLLEDEYEQLMNGEYDAKFTIHVRDFYTKKRDEKGRVHEEAPNIPWPLLHGLGALLIRTSPTE